MKYANMKNVITQHHIVALSSAKKVPSNALPTNNLWKMDSLVSLFLSLFELIFLLFVS